MKEGVLVLLLWAVPLAACSCGESRRAAAPAGPVLPDGLGVNIHFTDPQPGEMKMLAEGGFRWVRMDFGWDGTEKEKGTYDFSAYDRLMAALQPHGIRALFILDYSNRFYDKGLSPCSDEGRRAFARWAAAAVAHFKGRGILWEMYNEPNIFFWRPKPDVNQYVKLALDVGKAIREAAPGELYIGPATSGVDFGFLEACFKAGLLEYWSAVSVHPYRQEPPETAAADYARLRRLIADYAPKGRKIDILSGEWGYSSAWGGMNEEKQGKFLPRQWLTNLAHDVPLSIWYDWHDDGPDPKEPEHHFGTVLHRYSAGREPVYDPKPAYRAARALASTLTGFRFNKRLSVGAAEDHVLLFTRGTDVRLAAWTLSAAPHAIAIPASAGRFAVTGHTGEAMPPVSADAKGLSVTLTDAPQYLVPESPNDLLRLAAAWERAPLDVRLPAGKDVAISLAFENPLARPVRVAAKPNTFLVVKPGGRTVLTTFLDLPRAAEAKPVRVECDVEGMGRLAQDVSCAATNPLRVMILPPAEGALCVRIENPAGDAFKGTVRLTDLEGLKPREPGAALELKAGGREATVRFLLEQRAAAEYGLGVRIEDERGDPVLLVPAAHFALVDDFGKYTAETLAAAYELVPDGDPKVASTQGLALAAPPGELPVRGMKTLKLSYQFEKGWKFARLAPRAPGPGKIEGQPKALALWICGDGTGNLVRLRFTDATGQTFQPDGETLAWKGWRYVVFPMDGSHAGHWGGANDGVVHYPIRWDTLLLVDSAGQQKTGGEIYLGWPTLIR